MKNERRPDIYITVKDVPYGQRTFLAKSSRSDFGDYEVLKNTIDELAVFMSIVFKRPAEGKHRIPYWPFLNSGEEVFGENYRPFDKNELKYLKTELQKQCKD